MNLDMIASLAGHKDIATTIKSYIKDRSNIEDKIKALEASKKKSS